MRDEETMVIDYDEPRKYTRSGAQLRFNDLPFARQEAHLHDVARRALPLWGYPDGSTLRLLNLTENATFRVDPPHDSGLPRIAMRVHRLDYADRDSIEVELRWLLHLNETTDLRLATPLASTAGNLVETILTNHMYDLADITENRNVVCFSWVEGTAPLDSTDDTESMSSLLAALGTAPDSLTFPLVRGAAAIYDVLGHRGNHRSAMNDADRRLYRRLGEIAAVLRRNQEEWAPSHSSMISKRASWDWQAAFGPQWNNYYGSHYWDCSSTLSRHDVEAIDRARRLMRGRLEAYGTSSGRYGLIHSDLRPSNMLDDGTSLAVLDFDDCAYGWYMTDIAGIVGFMEHRPDLQDVLAEVLGGYESVWPLDPVERAEIPTFILMRRIGLFQSLLYHMHNTAPGSNEGAEISPELVAFYGKGTAMLARRYCSEFGSRPLPASEPVRSTASTAAAA